jgi:hypothetical protein
MADAMRGAVRAPFLRKVRGSISVVTAICGGQGRLIDDQAKGQARWVAFVDFPISSSTWDVRQAPVRSRSSRRNARMVKILIHQFVDTEFSIWIDGNQRLLKTPEELIGRYLQGYDLAVFVHPWLDCVYEEAKICADKRLDAPGVILDQARAYVRRGVPKRMGMGETMIVLRRYSPRVAAFNNAWWSELCRHSVRDQIAFPVARYLAGLRVNYISDGCPGARTEAWHSMAPSVGVGP